MSGTFAPTDTTLEELQQLERRYAIPTYVRNPVQFVRGSGVRLWDADGNEYLDFLAGISVVNVGHCHPRVVEAVREQAARLTHATNLYYTEPALRLSARLSDRSLGGKVFLTNSGAEAIEAAIKLVRRARPRGTIVVLQDAFHGRTYGALSATPQEAKQAPFAPLVPGFVLVPKDPAALAAAVDADTAAVLLEPIQGESGINVLDDELLRAAREACDRTEAALVFDEIQCGMGRTGTLWAYEQTGVVPDALTTAKALGGGFPIGALITGERLADALGPGDHGSTFAGGPVVCAAALVALELCSDPALLARVGSLGARLAAGLERLPFVHAVRGRGLMLAIDVIDDVDAPALARRALLEQRLVVNATGPGTIRLEPPLVVSEAEIDEAVARLEALGFMSVDYLLPDGMTLASAGRELASRMPVRARPARDCDRAYYDTFDGLLHAAGLVAIWDGGELALADLDGNAVLARTALGKPGTRLFAGDLPAGRLRDALRELIDVRALLPLTEIRSRERSFDVLDDEGKTVVRICLEQPAAGRRKLAARAQVRGVRGYERAERRLRVTLESDLRFPVAEQVLVDQAVSAAGREPGGTSAGVHVPLEPGERADRAAAAVLRALLAVTQANLEGAIADIDSEFLHDLRVSVRRSRAVQREMRRALGGPELEGFRGELRWLQQVTGDARDLDVYTLEFDAMRVLVPEPVRGDLDPVLALLRRRRAAAHRRMARALGSERAGTLLREWGWFLDRVEELPTDERPDAVTPIEAVAGRRIRKVYRRMVKMGSALDDSSPSSDYHELRKKGKELRYLLELFGLPLYPEDAVRPMIKSLKALQDVLGRHQDREIQVATLRSLGDKISSGPGGASALMAMGMLVERLGDDQRAAGAAFAERFEAFGSRKAQRAFEESFS